MEPKDPTLKQEPTFIPTAEAARALGQKMRHAERAERDKQKAELERRDLEQHERIRTEAVPAHLKKIAELIQTNADKGLATYPFDGSGLHQKYVWYGCSMLQNELEGLGYRVDIDQEWVPPDPGSADDGHAYKRDGFQLYTLSVRW